MDEADLREVAVALVVLCLEELVCLGRVEPADVNRRWYVVIDPERLASRDLAGAVTLDGRGGVVLLLLPNLSIEGLLGVVAHEVVHLVQMCRGELVPLRGCHAWKEDLYETLPAGHPDYFLAQPWEAEAAELQPVLLRHLRARFAPLL